jgi:ribosomal protein S8
MAHRRSDERLWAIAQTDARLMSELQNAMNRSDQALASRESSTQRRVARMLKNRQYYI